MKVPTSLLTVILTVPLLASCIKAIDFELPLYNDRPLVVDGFITDLNHKNYVRLTYARAPREETVEKVDDALVIIESSSGVIDTLLNERLIEGYGNREFEGYYYTNKLVCKPGETYFLKIDVKGKLYEATAYLPPVESLDSVSLYVKKDFEIEYESFYSPLLHFTKRINPNGKCMVQFCDTSSYAMNERLPCRNYDKLWNIALIDLSTLPTVVNGLDISIGVSPSLHVGVFFPTYSMTNMFSLTDEAFLNYKTLSNSLQSDGGVYSPAPATAKTNIRSKHPVVGFFNASALSRFKIKIPPPLNN